MKKYLGGLASALSGLGLCILSTGCGAGVTADSSGSVKLRFSNAQNSPVALDLSRTFLLNPGPRMATTGGAAQFSMMLIAAYLAADIDPTTGSNVGGTAMIYLNPDCADDIMHCDISGGTAEDGQPMSKVVTSFFNFAQPSSTVNAALNAQGRSIEAGTYKYARLEFCKYNSGNADNIKWASGGGSVNSFKRNSCTVNSNAFTTPITVAAGDTITITLSYDYSSAVQTGSDASGDHCVGSGSSKECFTLPTFVPSASR